MNNLNKSQKIIFTIILVIITGIIGYYIYENNQENIDTSNNEEILIKPEEETKDESGKIVVHITGAVKKEGVVVLDEKSRITDAVSAAGGLTDDADMSKINLAYILEDGVKVRIPSVNDNEEAVEDTESIEFVENVENSPESTLKSQNNTSNLVNINKATQTELETLPGIGPSTALKILNYREENGKFSSIEDLKNISGIGDSKFENIKNLICV